MNFENVPKLTIEQAAIISVYTGYAAMGILKPIHELCNKLIGRELYTHELGDKEIMESIKVECRPLFESICP
jgi:hypothetical protein